MYISFCIIPFALIPVMSERSCISRPAPPVILSFVMRTVAERVYCGVLNFKYM